MREDNRSPIWGGATGGLLVGLILGFFVGSSYWMTVLYAVLVGAGLGVIGALLGAIGDRMARKRAMPLGTARNTWHRLLLNNAEHVLNQTRPEDFETTQNAASMCVTAVANVEIAEAWDAKYESLDAFYAAHDEQHPDIRLYAGVAAELEDDIGGDPDNPPNGIGALVVAALAVHAP